jgi:hypothetical protein
VKDISLDKYEEVPMVSSLKKPNWKKKYPTVVYDDVYNRGGIWDKK